MEKAYDVKLLLEKLKENGLDIAEESAKAVVESVFDWVEASIPLSKTIYDDMALVVLPPLKNVIMDAVDKIDGEEG